ncbi:hypothetical protein DM02DRAFT_635211 [Periconia macrospinosa]|uniref:Uncharacterized protein n=1 Tax=Periconia macrospinosa TaxID=97972 RepID=A0A2V1D3I7_9PLEO|nr:hypothetical protein DM02DRAFT_635211 [Periconia macrospinosa]
MLNKTRDMKYRALPRFRRPKDSDPQQHPQSLLTSLKAADWWVYELLSLFLSAAALIVMIILLSKLDRKPQPSWAVGGNHCDTMPDSNQTVCRSVGISVNSVVAWLGAIVRVCLLVPLSNGLGQLKWNWFSEKERPLSDFTVFDSASRGVSGSIQLVWRLKAKHLATISALGIILSVALDPFIQNLVGYHTQPALDLSQTAYVSNNSIYDAPIAVSSDYPIVGPDVKGSIYAALTSTDPRQTWAQPHYVCSSGDCEWPPIASISMCTSCQDTTPQVKKLCKMIDKKISSGDRLNCTLALSTATASLTLDYTHDGTTHIAGDFLSVSTNGDKATLMDARVVSSIYLNVDPQGVNEYDRFNFSDQGPGYLSSVCTISPCVQSIRSSYKQSRQTADTPSYKEEVLKEWLINTRDMSHMNNILPFAPEYGLHNQTFRISQGSMKGISSFFALNVNGRFTNGGRDSSYYLGVSGDGNSSSVDAIAAIWNGNYTGHDCPSINNRVSCALELVTKAMSKTFRDRPWVINGTLGAAGEAFSPVVFVRVNWYWISLPACVWVLALVTFLGAAWNSRNSGVFVWRNSPLPLVFMRLHEERQGFDGVSEHLLSERAENLHGRLHATHSSIDVIPSTSSTTADR